MVKNIWREYRQLTLVVAIIIISLVVQFGFGNTTLSNWLLGLAALANAVPLVWGMVQDLRDGKYGVDILAATAIIASVWLGEYWTAIVIVLMLTGGEALENYAEGRAKKELTSLINNKPREATLLTKKGGTKVVNVSEIKIGDMLQINLGDIVPVDGLIVDGASEVNEASLTGEPLPIDKKKGDEVLSGSINEGGALTVKAIREAKDSQYETIIKLVKSAQSSQSPFVRMADRYAIPFTIISYIIAGTAWFISKDPQRFLEVIVVATPCPLLLGAPIAMISGMSRAARHGVIVKTSSALEKLARVKTFAFDKTGTLTRGEPEVKKIETFGNFSKEEIIAFTAGIEAKSSHLLAKKIVAYAGEMSIKPVKMKHVTERAGLGLQGRAKDHQIVVGKKELLEELGVEFPKNLLVDTTAVYVGIDAKLSAIFHFEDTIRSSSTSTLDRLKSLGASHLLMVTGDNERSANAIAKKLHITDVAANCLPGDKIIKVQNADKPVAFVGDGVNDAPVLTSADVGIALGAKGSAAASESADIVIMVDSLSRVGTAFEVAKRTIRVGKQAIMIGIFISVGLMLIFATGRFEPIHGALIQEVVDVIVMVYALRAHGPFGKADTIE